MKKMISLSTPAALIASTFLLLASCDDTNDESREQPNIIIFLADDLGYGDLGCYGNPIVKTPAIDKFASEGVRLTDCHSAGTVCSPSRAGLLTGRNPYRSGFYYIQGAWAAHLRDNEITVAELLQSAGYETAFMGKWHLSRLEKGEHEEPDTGEQGFDHWLATTRNAFEGPRNPEKFILNGNPVGTKEGWYCDILVKEATRWLTEKRDRKKPFFLIISTHEPYTPINPPKEHSDLYENPKVDSLERSIQYGEVARPDKDIGQNKKEYYGTLTQLDQAFANLLAVVEKEHLEDNTLIIFTSDNGPEHPVNLEESRGEWEDPIRDFCFGTPGTLKGMKRYPYEGGHRVPGIVRWPATIPGGTVSNELVNATDFAPTICKLVGIDMPTDRAIDGMNAFPALMGDQVKREKPCLWIFPTHEDTYLRMPQMAMRLNEYTLVGWFPEKDATTHLLDWMKISIPEKFALYNTHTDPGQENDIADEKPEVVKELVPKMVAKWIEVRDEGPDWR